MGDWNILTVTEGGTVSILKNLSEDQARQAMRRLRPRWESGDPWSDDALRRRASSQVKWEAMPDGIVFSSSSGVAYTVSDSDIKSVECWGPEGQDLVVWPKPPDADDRLAAFVAEERARLSHPEDTP